MNSTVQIAYYFTIAILSISFIILCLTLLFRCRKRTVESQETPLPVKLSAQAYPLTDIDVATDGFNHRRVIGKGRLGTVYAAVLPRGDIVAVKRIHPSRVLCNAALGFSSMLKSLSLVQHPNLVSILGYSQAPGERIIISEFVGMMSLDYYLHEKDDGASLLDWSRRIRIAARAARGLEYLHEGIAPNVVHGCLKASNILLDEKLCVKISDYGLSFLAHSEQKDLVGYVDDEYWIGSGIGACKESDVYGFGVLLLELLTGRRTEDGLLVKWALPLIKDMRISELLDPRLVIPSYTKQIIRLAKVASACVSNSRKSRPTMVQVAAILNNLEDEVCV
ncbi:hypothetical protein K2173_000775 [Erythroxylum novogranatense]|uniref:Protein kinase domain-containing protein n=1 Tax=Erythroxylum novogranatense TaxID=1862640 RepID=A0AAV8T2W3_9ROSI|nr:hypothetical protein K2173_000775 [Erythroxylum novogranatense]